MANLGDNIRLTTVADLQALSQLVNEYKKLGLSISGVAGASRIVSEQIKRDALEQANATKQATLQTQQSTAELNRQSAELRKNNLELKAQAAALGESKKSSDGLFGSLSSLSGLRSQLIGLFGVMSVGSFAKDIIDAQSQIQAFDLSMKNLLGEKYGTKLTEDLKRFTVETPLNFEQVIKSSNQLVGSFKAAGASSETIGKEIPIILESLGNSAAALGGDDRLGRLTYAFSQVQATGRLMGTEVRQITETGFPLLAVMAQQTGIKVDVLKQKITAGEVDFKMFKDAILSAGIQGGVFAGSMDIMANTVRGRLDKLSETFFFVKGKIGEFFEDSARSGLNFVNSLLKAFFGTDEAIAETIGTIEIAIKTWAGYKILMTSIAVIEKAMLILEGQKILAAEAEIALRVKNLLQLKAQRIERGLDVLGIDAQIAAINALSTAKVREAQANLVALQEQRALTLARGLDVVAIDAQIATTTAFIARQTLATTAATSFATRISSILSPTVLITAAIAALVVVYKEVSDAIEKANQLNYDWVKSNDSQIVSVRESNIRMKIAAESVMRLKEGTDLHRQALGDLIKTYPQYFGQLDIEKTKNSQIKAIYDQVNKSIETKIGLMAREKIAEETLNRLVSIRQELIKSGVKSTNIADFNKESTSIFDFSGSRSKIVEYNKLLEQQAQNEKAMTQDRIKNFNIEYMALRVAFGKETLTRYEFLTQRENLMVKYHLKETAATITHNASQEAQEKETASKKYKINADTAEQKEIFNELVRVKALKKTREHEQQILDLQNKYDVSKVNSATGAAIIKADKLDDLENKYRIKKAELTSKWDAKETGAAKTFANQSLKLQEDTAKEKDVFDELVYVKGLEKTRQHETALLDIQQFYDLSKIQNAVGSQKKKNEETAKITEKYLKDTAELNSKWVKGTEDRNKSLLDLEKNKYELSEKLRIINLILAAKSSDEIQRIEEEAADNILKENKKTAERQLAIEVDKLKQMALKGKEGTLEYIKQDGIVLESKSKLAEAEIKLTDLTLKSKKKATKEEEDLINKLQKLDEDNKKDSIELEKDKQELIGKLRALELISKAKNSKDAIEIQNKENEKIIKGNVERAEKQLSQEKAVLAAMAMIGQQNTEQYKKQQAAILKGEKQLTDAQIKLAEFLTDKKKDQLEKNYDFTAQSIVDLIKIYKFLNDNVAKDNEELQRLLMERDKAALGATLFLTNLAMDAISTIVDKNIAKTSDGIRKIELEHNKAVLGVAQQATSAAMSFLSGDIAGGITKGLGALVNGISLIGSKSAAVSKYWTEKAITELEDYGKKVESEVDRIIARIDDIRQAYGDIKLSSGDTIGNTLSEDLGLDLALKNLWEIGTAIKKIPTELEKMAATWNLNPMQVTIDSSSISDWRTAIEISGHSVEELIQAEITRGQQIQKNYEDAVEKENDLFEKRKESAEQTYKDSLDNIKKLYDEEVASIDKKYDYETLRANQQYDAQTLGIVAAGSAQLEALITNESVLSEIRAEFAAKRLEIEKAFPLASKAITEGMSQAEIDAINASIEARDEQFAKLQGWYNEELIFIAESEGQKRKEYSETAQIQKQIQEKLELAAIAFSAAEIERERLKGLAIEAEDALKQKREDEALAVRDAAKLVAKEANDAALVALEKKKNEDIATSFKILTELLKIYSEDITRTMEATSAKGSEAYRKLAQELNAVNELLKQIRGNAGVDYLKTYSGLNATPFEKGTDNTSVSLSGATVDNRGGKLAILHPEEAVFSKADMTQMTRFLGKRPTRDEVIDRFKMGAKLIDSNSFIQKISPYVISKTEGNVNIDLNGLRSDLSKLTREVVKRQQPIVNIDKNGIRTYLTNINSQIEIKNQKFSS